MTNREEAALDLPLVQGVQEVGLILASVHRSQQACRAVLFESGIVAGCDGVGTVSQRIIEKGAEFDFLVAQDVRIRCTPGLVFI